MSLRGILESSQLEITLLVTGCNKADVMLGQNFDRTMDELFNKTKSKNVHRQDYLLLFTGHARVTHLEIVPPTSIRRVNIHTKLFTF